MPKNKKLNSFYFFMLDFKKQEEKKGRRFPNGLKDVQNDVNCNEIWKNLPPEEKAYYKKKERDFQIKSNINIKKTTLGESLDEVQEEQLLKEQFLNNMQENISLTLKQAKQNNYLEKLKFYIIHVNYFYIRIINNEAEYCPAEIGIAEFSLQKGITRIYHKIVNSEIQLGYSSAATEYSRDTHQIPKCPKFGESDYGIIYKEIIEFLEPGKLDENLPPLYTRYKVSNIKYPVLYILDTLANFSKNFMNKFTVYSFEELFVNLCNINFDEYSNMIEFDDTMASFKLQEDPFDYNKNLQCEYHQTTGAGNYCSQSHVQRWIYLLFQQVCPLFGIYLIVGVHLPVVNENSEDNSDLETEFRKVNLCKYKTYNPMITTQVSNKISYPRERTYVVKESPEPETVPQPPKSCHHNPINRECLIKKLRPPFIRSGASKWLFESNDINLSEHNFPSIGRGSAIRKKISNDKSTPTALRF